jgi:outer membrane protein, multidrug efflux system
MRRIAPIVALMLAGCALQPPPPADELRKQALPNTAVPPAWAASADAGEVTRGWLATFNDPALEALVSEAVTYNYDLQVAAARVEAAEASARAAGAALYPQLNLIGRGGGKSGDGGGLNMIGLFANWELDIWGRVRAGRAQAGALYDSAVLDAVYARQSIAALVAKSWFLAREAAVQGAIASEMVAASESLLGLSQDRKRVGNADDFEVATAEASVLGYRDLVLQADIARRNALRAIELLTGRYPAAQIDAGSDLPVISVPVPAGLPSQLLERRPDVGAAERRVAAAFHATQVAQAARLPRIALTAAVNGVSSELVVLKESNNPMWSVGATLMAPVFSAGALEAQVDIRTADQKAAIAEYGRIGSRAFSEVEGALSTSASLQARAEVLARAVRANEGALGFARVRYDVGNGDQRGVQNQLLALHASRTTLVHVQAERLIQRVNLYLALGGGFEAGSP